ncbi:MAG TPA: hypothetical protein VFZ61_33670 [Polyangiales bacterium]
MIDYAAVGMVGAVVGYMLAKLRPGIPKVSSEWAQKCAEIVKSANDIALTADPTALKKAQHDLRVRLTAAAFSAKHASYNDHEMVLASALETALKLVEARMEKS